MNANIEAPTAQLLFVDDEPNVLKALKRLFRSAEYAVHLAESGAAGLEILRTQAIDLIISDMRMPQMDGAEFLSRAAENHPDTVRILLTGYADIESTIAAVNNGRIYSYCSKPWEDNELKILVNNALDQKRLREERQRLYDIVQRQNLELKELNSSLEEKVEKRTEQLKKSLQVIEQANESLKRQYNESVKAFARIIEMRPGIKSGHAKYIAEHAKEVAQRLGLPPAEVRNVVFAGLLLQIGKMSLPDSLLTLPHFSMNGQQRKRFFESCPGRLPIAGRHRAAAPRRRTGGPPIRILRRFRLPGRPGGGGDTAGQPDFDGDSRIHHDAGRQYHRQHDEHGTG